MTETMSSYKQVRRLLKLADAVEATDPKNFNMGAWMQTISGYDDGGDPEFECAINEIDEIPQLVDEGPIHTTDDLLEFLAPRKGRPVACNTTACVGGAAILQWPKEAVAISKRDGITSIEAIAQRLLGYDSDTIGNLFYSSAPWQTPTEAAAELRRRASVILTDHVDE